MSGDDARARWQRLDALLDEAFELAPEAWPELLDRRTGGDLGLRREAEELLAAHLADGPGLLRESAPAAATAILGPPEAESPPDRFGPWRVLGRLGEGGMGEVLLAERADGEFEQRVALKRVRPDLASHALVERFRRERQILARLEHPGIARLVDGGVDEAGRPWLALEYVDGEPITAWCESRSTPVEERLRLMLEVCGAVADAHRSLVVHRDLKPSNILVGDDGRVKLLDFGIATMLGPEGGAPATRVVALTPEYASPEQLAGLPVTTAADVYSLGVVLHELLTGSRPTPGRPGRPSSLVRSRPDDAGVVLARRLRGDLDAIVLKALRPEPERRYASVDALADDVARHLERRPVAARGDERFYRAERFVRRHRVAVAGALLVVFALVGGLATTRREARRADAERASAEAARDFLIGLFDASDPAVALGDDPSARELLARGRERIEHELGDQPRLRAELLATLADVHLALGDAATAEALRREELGLREALSGARSAEAVAARIAVADAVSDQGRSEEAESLFRDALAVEESERGRDTVLVARALRGLGGALSAMSRYDEAEPLEREALAIFARRLGVDEPETLQMRNNLAMLLLAHGDFDDAEHLMREVLAARIRLEGEDGLEALWARFNLAATLLRAGQLTAAAELGAGVADGFRRIYGADHFMSVRALRLEARLADLLGHHDRARPLREEALETARRVLSPSERLYCLVEYSEHLRLSGDLVAAEAAAREAVVLGIADAGPGADLTAWAESQLGAVLVDRGELAAARPLLEHAEAVQREVGGDDYPDRLQTRSWLGRLALLDGRTGDAREILEDTLARRRATVGPTSLRTAESLVDLADALDPGTDDARRRALIEEARAISVAALPAGHPTLAALSRR